MDATAILFTLMKQNNRMKLVSVRLHGIAWLTTWRWDNLYVTYSTVSTLFEMTTTMVAEHIVMVIWA